jgi:hypothetical protein
VIRVPDGEFDDDELDQFETPARMRPARDGQMPVHGAGSSIRGRHREKADHRPRRRPRRPDGMHRRRVKKFE